MARLTAELVVSLIDRVTQPAKTVAASMGRLREAQAQNARQMRAARGAMLDAVAMGFALAKAVSAPIQSATAFQTAIEDIGQKVGRTRGELVGMAADIRRIGRETGQGAAQVAMAIDNLVGKGASETAATAMADPIARAATAYLASADDLASAAFAAHDNLKVPAEQISRVLDVMAAAGKEGAFELRDMAAEFPALTAAAQALGIEGVAGVSDLAAALEVARKGAASGSQAANNMANFLQKIVSKRAIKNFKAFGVDIPKEMAKAAERGVSPIEHMLDLINDITEGGQAEKVAQLFGDKQVVEFLRPMLANMEEYRRIRAEALNAIGTVEEDFQRRLETNRGRRMVLKSQIEDLSISIGNALLPAFSRALAVVAPFVREVSALADTNPAVTASVVGLTGSLIALRVATLAGRYAFLFMRGGLLDLGVVGVKTAKVVVGLTKKLRLMVLGASMLAKVGGGGLLPSLINGMKLAGVAAAGLSWPIALVGAAIVGLGLVVRRYWEPISNFFAGMIGGFRDHLAPLIEHVRGLGRRVAEAATSWARTALINIGAALGIDEATITQAFDVAMATVTAGLDRIRSFLTEFPASVGNWFKGLFAVKDYSAQAEADFRAAGQRAGAALANAVINAAEAIIKWFRELPGKIRAAIGKIDLSGIVRWPSMPWWLGGRKPETPTAPSLPGADAARAAGGPIVGGKTYLVGEYGPELVTPYRSGYVHDAETTANALAGGADRSLVVSFGDIVVTGVQDAQAVAAEIEEALRDRLSGLQADMEWSVA